MACGVNSNNSPKISAFFTDYCSAPGMGFPLKIGLGIRIRECSQRKMHCCAWANICTPREYWIIYRGPSFLAVVWFRLLPHPFSPSARPRKRDNLLSGRGWGRSQVLRRRESPVLYKSFNTLCAHCSVQGKVRAEHKLKQMMIETDANRTFIRLIIKYILMD